MRLKSKMSLDEFLEVSAKNPNLLFNSMQRLYAAVDRYGKTNGKWNFIYKQPNDDRGDIKELFGLDSQIDELVTRIKVSTQDQDEGNKLLVLLGPAGSGKSEVIKTLASTMESYYNSDEGSMYRAWIHMDDIKEKFKDHFPSERSFNDFMDMLQSRFGEIKDLKVGLGANIQTAIYLMLKRDDKRGEMTKIEKAIENINSDIESKQSEYWKRIHLNRGSESSTITEIKTAITSGLEKFITKKDGSPDYEKIYSMLESVISIEKATKADILPYVHPVVASGEKNFDYKAVFGGEIIYPQLSRLGGNNVSPLAYNYGVAGSQISPSATGGIVIMDEVLKSPESAAKGLLDLLEDRFVYIKTSFKEPFDAVIIGATNLGDYSEMTANLKPHMMRRIREIYFQFMYNMNDISAATAKMFSSTAKTLGAHFSPNFLTAMDYLISMSALEEYPNIPLDVKAEMIAGIGNHSNKGVTVEEMRRAAFDSKRILERSEGIKLGIPYTEIKDFPTRILNYCKRIEANAQKNSKQSRNDNGSPCMDSIFGSGNSNYLEDLLTSIESLYPETRERLDTSDGGKGKALVQIAFDKYRNKVKFDVIRSLYQDTNALKESVNKYVLHKFFERRNDKMDTFIYNGKTERVDHAFINEIEKKSGVPKTVGDSIYNVFLRYGDEGITDAVISKVADSILEDYAEIGKAILDMSKDQLIAKIPSGITAIKEGLKKRGYCDKCADIAYFLFSSPK
ncbi:(d)CMP kinase [Candidatus Parvarchaeota archaeon]|nr:(d)CMP kinase [Candidatus Parvarchaeota archaeon]